MCPAVLESEKEEIKVEIPIEVIEWPVDVSDYRYDRVHRRPCGADLASDRSESMKGDGPTIPFCRSNLDSQAFSAFFL